MENLLIINENKRKNLNFSRCNLVFGYCGAGKTKFLEELNGIFSGKNKNWLYNGCNISSMDFNVISISGNENINSHLKLSSKSLLSKYIAKNNFSNEFKIACETLSETLEYTRKEIELSLSNILNDAKVNIKSIDDPLDFILGNISITCSDISSSDERKSLLSLIKSITKLNGSKTIVLIDDFTNNLDEENICSFINDILNLDAYFVLATNKTIPQYFLNNEIKIFAIRDNEAFCFQDLDQLLIDAIEGQPEYYSFEEYMLGKGYTRKSGILNLYIDIIRNDINTNFFRILTSKNPIINDKYIKGKITIVPRSPNEEKLYKYIFELLKISNDN